VSYGVYGPIKTIDKRYATYHDISLKLFGDRILMYLQGNGEWSIYDLGFNKISTIKNSMDFARTFNLTIHRFGKLPELYTGHRDGDSPRCPSPRNTCASELERYVYGENTTEVICPNEGCDEGCIYVAYYDAKTGKILAGTSGGFPNIGSGNKLYIIDPNTKTYVKWRAAGAGSNTHFQCMLYVYDENTLYVGIKKQPRLGGEIEIRKYDVSEFYDVFGTGYIEDYGERVYYDESLFNYDLAVGTALTNFPFRKEILVTNEYGEYYLFNLDNFTRTRTYIVSIYGKYGISMHPVPYVLRIIDRDANTVLANVTLEHGEIYVDSPQIDAPFVVTQDENSFYIYLVTLNGVAPVIQYNHNERKFRVVDFITGNPVTADVWIVKSRFCFPSISFPINIQPTTIRVSDWTPIPSAKYTECVSIMISDVVV